MKASPTFLLRKNRIKLPMVAAMESADPPLPVGLAQIGWADDSSFELWRQNPVAHPIDPDNLL